MKLHEGIPLKKRLRKKKIIDFQRTISILIIFMFLGVCVFSTYGDYLPKKHTTITIEKEFDLGSAGDSLSCLNWVNEDYLKDLKKIEFKRDIGKMSHPNYKGDKSGGDYNEKLKTIRLTFINCRGILHEVGHHIFDNHLTEKQKEEWKEIFKYSRRFVTSYAKLNYEEDFAESFYFFIEDRFDIINCDNPEVLTFYGEFNPEWSEEEYIEYVLNERCDDIYRELNFEERKIKFIEENIKW